MQKSFKRTLFQKFLLAVLFLLPSLMFNFILQKHGSFFPFLPLLIFLSVAVIIAEATRKSAPGKEDYVLIPLLLLTYFPFDLSPFNFVFKIPAFLILGVAAFLLLRKR